MKPPQAKALATYAIGIPITAILYYALAIAFIGHLQGLADSHVSSVPWYYSFASFFVAFPFLHPSEFIAEFTRRLFGSDNTAIFTMVALQGVFWGFVTVFCFRFVRRFYSMTPYDRA